MYSGFVVSEWVMMFSELREIPESYGQIDPAPKIGVTNASFYLEQRLLQGYSSRAIPNDNHTSPFMIYSDLTLYQLLELVSHPLFYIYLPGT